MSVKLLNRKSATYIHRTAAIAADAEFAGIIEGTSDHPGVAAGSLVLSNITNDGDILFAVSDNGNSKGLLKLNGADGVVELHGNIRKTISNEATVGQALTISSGSTTAGTTNNVAGGALTLQGGQGKGSGAGGDIIFQTANAGSSGSSLNSLATALTISDDLSSTFAGIVDVSSASRGFAIGNLGGTERIYYLSSTFGFLTAGNANAAITAGNATFDGDLEFTGPQAISTTSGNLTLTPATGLILNSVNAGVTAHTGSAQGGETITKSITQIATCGTSGDAVTLPTAVAGLIVFVLNDGAEAADVFPNTSDNINEAGDNAAYSLAANKNAMFIAHDAQHWSVILTA
jgi:hypothetical protein